MRINVALGVGLAVALVGCVDQPETLSETESLLRHNAFLPNGVPVLNGHGFGTTVSTQGRIDLSNEFFQDLGTNGRRCVSCHLPTAGWTVTPEQMQAIFVLTDGGELDDGFGLGAVFRTNDGANSPKAKVNTLHQRRAAYSMLLTKGLIRVGLPVPANADYELIAVDDPYGFASAQELSLFRRPLPSTNLKFLSTVMWDGRVNEGGTIHFDLSTQANGATEGHAEGESIDHAQREAIVAFETSLHTAQVQSHHAGNLSSLGAKGGTAQVVAQNFYIGINDNFGDYETGDDFTPNAMTLYGAWANRPGNQGTEKARRAVARGEKLFNTARMTLEGVGGLNDDPRLPASFDGTCTTCHNTPNAGNHSVRMPLDIGLTDASRRTPDMPLYTFRKIGTNEIRQTTDPGVALVSGKFADIGKFKGPILRGLAARAPYFHDGSARTLVEAVEFYNTRFEMGLSAQDKSDLAAFLASL